MSEIWATIAGMIDKIQPDPNPYKHAKTIIGAFELAGNHSPRLITPENAAHTIMTLKGPILSARYAGSSLPRVLVVINRWYTYSVALNLRCCIEDRNQVTS